MKAANILDGLVPFPVECIDETSVIVAEEFERRSRECSGKDYSIYESFCKTGARDELNWPLELVIEVICHRRSDLLMAQRQNAHLERSEIVISFWGRSRLGQEFIAWSIEEGDRWQKQRDMEKEQHMKKWDHKWQG